jgi:hypothetical protein
VRDSAAADDPFRLENPFEPDIPFGLDVPFGTPFGFGPPGLPASLTFDFTKFAAPWSPAESKPYSRCAPIGRGIP